MLRASLIAAGFIAITLALILVQPGKPRSLTDNAPLSETDVTRAALDLSSLDTTTLRPEPLVNGAARAMQPAEPASAPVSATPAAAIMPAESELHSMVLGALQQGQSEGYIDALVNDAAQKGRVEVPSALVTAEGRVDTALLLSALTQPARPRVPNTYTVTTGDSLASIAYRFYGDFSWQAEILAANTETLQPTERLRVGQVLNLPTP